jgi:DNA-binding GntR family transcriptional regulator
LLDFISDLDYSIENKEFYRIVYAMKEPLKEKAYNYVLKRIVNGSLQPGERLSEVAMAKEIGISPTPLREAYRQLASEGFVKHVPNSGIFVRKITEPEIIELYETRQALETFCAGKAATRMNALDLNKLRKCVDIQHLIGKKLQGSGMEQLLPEDEIEYMKADAEFHVSIIKSAGNEIIAKTMRECHVIGRLLSFRSHKHTLGQVATTFRHHSKILKAIYENDSQDAAFWMEKHIKFSCETALANRKDSDKSAKHKHSEELHNFIYNIETI